MPVEYCSACCFRYFGACWHCLLPLVVSYTHSILLPTHVMLSPPVFSAPYSLWGREIRLFVPLPASNTKAVKTNA